jgi:hypothetical protein
LAELVEGIENEQHPWCRRKWWALSSFVNLTCEHSRVVGMLFVSIENFVFFLRDNIESIAQVSLAFFTNFTQDLTLLRCSENRSLNFARRPRNTHVLPAPQLIHNWC